MLLRGRVIVVHIGVGINTIIYIVEAERVQVLELVLVEGVDPLGVEELDDERLGVRSWPAWLPKLGWT